MPADVMDESLRMLAAGAIVSAVALPMGAIGWALARSRSQALLPTWKPWRVPWSGFEVVFAFLVLVVIVPPIAEITLLQSGFYQAIYGPEFPVGTTPPSVASGAVAGMPATAAAQENFERAAVLRQLWARSLALPVQIGLLVIAVRLLYPTWRTPAGPGVGPSLFLASAAWFVLTPFVLGGNLFVNVLFTLLDAPPDSHGLTNFGSRRPFDAALFLFQVSVAAPVVEEVLFRGIILAWALGSVKPQAMLDVPSRVRPWLIAGMGIVFAVGTMRTGPIVFSVLLALGLLVVVSWFPRKRRTWGAIYSTAACFAAMHSSVWPSPIPLFFLGLGLGWLAVRTRGVVVPIIVHGLFNAVSAVFLLRGSAG